MVILAAILQSCAAIPTMVPDMALKPAKAPLLDNANGSLSQRQSAAILAKLSRDGVETNIFSRHLALEAQIAGSPLVIGNRIQLLVDGPSTYDAMFLAIAQAEHNINLETFTIEDDDVGRRFSTLLCDKQHQGVQVNLIYDSVGSLNTSHDFFTPMIASGVSVLEFNPINPLLARKEWGLNRRDHRKLLVVDGKTAFVGGINISSVYSGSSFGRSKQSTQRQIWRDTHLRLEGPVVAEFQKLFLKTWEEQKGNPLAAEQYFPPLVNKGPDVVRAIGSSPAEAFSLMYATLLSAIASAETQVWLTNAYFIPDARLQAELKSAVMRGVDVRLLLPHATDSALVFYASRSFYTDLLAAGVKIYERQDAFLHAKTALIDGVWSTIGSTNLDWRSFVNNQEINAVMLGADFGMQMAAMFEKDLVSSKQITLAAWRERPIFSRLKEIGARLWARWL